VGRGRALAPDVLAALRLRPYSTIFTLTRYVDRDWTSIRWCLERLRRYGIVGSDKSVRPQRWFVAQDIPVVVVLRTRRRRAA
jgi:hypothetical protein